MPALRKRAVLNPEIVPGGGNQVGETFHKAEVALNRILAVTSAATTTPAPAPTPTPAASVTSLNGLQNLITLAATNNCVLTISGQTITIDGRSGPRFGYRFPQNGENITIGDGDFTIYGNSSQKCANVLFPLASSCPGKYVIFTYPPSGSLGSSGAAIAPATSGTATSGTGTSGGTGGTVTPLNAAGTGDTVDAYSGQTAAYQSDGGTRWVRVWSIG